MFMPTSKEWITVYVLIVAIGMHVQGIVEKRCPTPGPNIHITGTVPATLSLNTTIEVVCDEGYSFSIDMSVTSQNRTCIDDGISTDGVWDPDENCTVITCPTPATNSSNVIMTYSSLTFDSALELACISGYGFVSSTTRYSATFTCNSSSSWAIEDHPEIVLEEIVCEEIYAYIGCLDDNSLIAESEISVNGRAWCYRHCADHSYRIYGLRNSTCYCGNELEDGYSVRDNSDCITTCPVYTVGEPLADHDVFCGGLDTNSISVYATFEGCFEGTTLTSTLLLASMPTGSYKKMCKEMCRGNNKTHVILHGNQCYCLTTSDIDGNKTDDINCQNITSNNIHYIHDLALTSVSASTCEELFYEGVRYNGLYQLNQPLRYEWCDFADGTACGDDWIGFGGHCYHFNNQDMMNYTTARNYCLSLGADFVSILNKEENDFLNKTRILYKDLWSSKEHAYWWIGLYDNMNTSLYTWLDGHVMIYNKFFTSASMAVEDDCAVDIIEEDKWVTTNCDTENHNVMCKKEQESNPYTCVEWTSPETAVDFLSELMMSRTYCLEECKGSNKTYAFVTNTTCSCVDSFEIQSNYTAEQCSVPCPGFNEQFCGGEGSEANLMNINYDSLVTSCQDLQLIGIGKSTFLTNPDDNTLVFEMCDEPGCPYGWLSINDVCYTFIPRSTDATVARQFCAGYDAYPVVIETEEEIDALLTTASNISLYKDIEHWRVGLQAISRNGGRFRWANGRIFNSSIWHESETGRKGVRVMAGREDWFITSYNNKPFICEKNSDYIGCYNGTGVSPAASLYNVSSMTIQLCVERCRTYNSLYAFLSYDSCLCVATHNATERAHDQCVSGCAGQPNQICGGVGVFSVYAVESYPIFANSCADLYDAGIVYPGYFSLLGQPSPQYCAGMDENTGNCSENWISFDGECYKHSFEDCSVIGGLRTSLTSYEQVDALATVLTTLAIDQTSLDYRVLSGVTDGSYGFNVYMSPDGMLFDPAIMVEQEKFAFRAADLHDEAGYMSFRMEQDKDFDTDGGHMCKKDKYTLGCFKKPTADVVVVLDNYGSMDLTLCKQLCISHDPPFELALLGLEYCGCINYTQFVQEDPVGDCSVPCPVNPDQICGDGTDVWAHTLGTNVTSGALTDDCTSLYASGVFYNSTYRKKANPKSKQQCGFTDSTYCPASWFGRNNTCFKFYISPVTVENARDTCFAADAHLFNPTVIATSLYHDVIVNSGIFDNTTLWTTGIMPDLASSSFGDFKTLEYVASLATVHLDYEGLLHTGTSTDEMGFICQKNKEYKGCYSITGTAVNYTTVVGNSLTMCSQFCHGVDKQYAAVSPTSCYCIDNEADLISSPGNCTTPCDGAWLQSCGGGDISTIEYFTVRHIVNESMTYLQSCSDLMLYSVFVEGQFRLVTPDNETYHIVNCNSNEQYIPDSSLSVTTSSTDEDSNPSTFGLHWPFTDVWRPQTNSVGEYLLFTLDTEYIVNGITMRGTFLDESFIISYSVHYHDVVTDTLIEYLQNGSQEILSNCDSGYTICTSFFALPIVTRQIKISPLAWNTSIATQISILGEIYSDFEDDMKYESCCYDVYDTFVLSGSDTNLKGCIEICKNKGTPYASVYVDGTCSCGPGCTDLGYNEDMCTFNETGQYNMGDMKFLALYRTFDRHCEPPDFANEEYGNITDIEYMYNHTDVYKIGSTVTLTCPPRTRRNDSSENDHVITCNQSNTWTTHPVPCINLTCPTPTEVVNGTVIVNSDLIDGSARVWCNFGYEVTPGVRFVDVTCQENQTWSTLPNCTESNIRQRLFRIQSDKLRGGSTSSKEIRGGSRFDCAVSCTSDTDCVGANYRDPDQLTEGTCRLFTDSVNPTDLTSDPEWDYIAPEY